MASDPVVALIGRLTGPKGALARRLVAEVFPQFPGLRFVVVGGPLDGRLRAGAAPNVSFTGWVRDLAAVVRGADLVIGSGRVALEAMRAAVPVLAVGEARHVGFVGTDTFVEARRTNFGDCDRRPGPDVAAVARDLVRFAAGFRPDVSAYPELLREYSWERVARGIEGVYGEALLERRIAALRGIPILCYHRVVEAAPSGSRANIYVTRDALAAQLDGLARRGFTTITFADLLAEAPLPKRPVILTFDDGYRDNYEHLLPLLESRRARAVVFALGNRTLRVNAWDTPHGEPEAPLMSDAELRSCCASGLVEIGAHGLNHRPLPSLPEADLDEELEGSKAALEDLLGVAVRAFAYPYGAWGERERERVGCAGFSFGIATDRGRSLAEDRFAAARRLIFPGTDGFGFWKKTSSWYPYYRRALGRTG